MSVFYRFQDSGLDDWDISKNYMQLGFRPGFAIQARELTQMQTILQAQITALAKRSLISGSVIDAQLVFNKNNGIWNATVNPGYIYIEPTDKQLGYFVYNSITLNLNNINVSVDSNGPRTYVYAVYDEVQINPDGHPFPAGGGYAEVRVDDLIKDNAQGYSNHSAPGASRYQINIVTLGSTLAGSAGDVGTNRANIAYNDPACGAKGDDSNCWFYPDTGSVI